jgi:hypothetical protein
VEVGSELANDTIPMLYFLLEAAACVVLAAELDDVLAADVLVDELLLLDPQPAMSTATTATASPTAAVGRKCVLNTTFSSPALDLRRTVS